MAYLCLELVEVPPLCILLECPLFGFAVCSHQEKFSSVKKCQSAGCLWGSKLFGSWQLPLQWCCLSLVLPLLWQQDGGQTLLGVPLHRVIPLELCMASSAVFVITLAAVLVICLIIHNLTS